MDERQWMNVSENWVIYDTMRIGEGVPAKYPGGAASPAALAALEEIPFLNIRNSSETGDAYCNISSKDKMPWAYRLESVGMRFTAPSPILGSLLDAISERNKAKLWMDEAIDHAWFELKIREDTILRVKPLHLPSGYGALGVGFSDIVATAATAGPSHSITNGEANVRNRFSYGKLPVLIPRDTPIKGTLRFSDTGRRLLKAMGVCGNMAFGLDAAPDLIPAEWRIELSLRGRREVQQRGEWHYGAEQG